MTQARPAPVTLAEFDEIFAAVKNWGRWGPDDELGTLNYITPDAVRDAARTVRSGRRVTMAIPMNTSAGPDNPSPVIHHVVQGHDIDIGSSGVTYNGRPAQQVMTSQGATSLDVTAYREGLVGRGVLLDVPRFRGVRWLEPGEAVTRAELEAVEQAEGVRLGEGDILVFRTGHHRRRLELGAWNNDYPPAGRGKAGLHVDTIRWMHERRIAAFLRTWPSPAKRGRFEFMVVGCRSGCPAAPGRRGTR
jgi:hypothetical protein